MTLKEESEKTGLKLNIQKTKSMASSSIISWQIDGKKVETVTDFIFLGSKITADGDCSQEIKRPLLLGRKAMTNLYSLLKSRDITLPAKVHIFKAMVFLVIMYGCEKAESLDSKEMKPVNPKGDKPWIFTGRTSSEAEAEAPILWEPNVKNQLIGKDFEAGKDSGQEEKETTEN